MTPENEEIMVAATAATTGLVFYTFPEHFYVLCETVGEAMDVTKEFAQITGLEPDVGTSSKDSALHVMVMMSYAVACDKGYQGTKDAYVAEANGYFEPLIDQYLRQEKADHFEDEIALS